MQNSNKNMDTIVNLAKNRGFVYAGSEIYGGLSNSWDYGPLGVEFKNNIKKAWMKKFVQESPYNVGLDSAILMNPQVWVTSGHVGGFSDPLMDCRDCRARHRADKLIEDAGGHAEGMTFEQMEQYIKDNGITCPECGGKNFTEIRKFNLMFKTEVGSTAEGTSTIYLRPETAQGIFVDYLSVQKTGRMKLPFGIAQIGKAFRNEIVARQFIFRMREFEQMEMQFFCKPGTEMEWFNYWKNMRMKWHQALGFGAENYRFHDHEKLAHYANAATDIEFNMPFGFKEVEGIHSRTNFDLSQHEKFSGKQIKYHDPETGESYTPYDVETSIGVDRMFLSVMCHSFEEEKLENGETRTVLHLPQQLAPTKLAILPLVRKDGLPELGEKIMKDLRYHFNCKYEDKDSIGKRYRRQDAIGTPYCITIDHDSLKDECVTLRNRDTMTQERIKIAALRGTLEDRVSITSLLKKIAED